ncbi:hypothetical protein JFL43_05320 [Viridibacillus sp. YIM B01967]|uniref:Integral membrane protein n=1 Tax=Viridibacillus soli TaxID=2798301 RepID=A0ABS1H4D8_9BACL|nr:hypothetical protein [Viridibacillus soli]MBK3494284.1 hypothetical protein [Viridibacillus soli]
MNRSFQLIYFFLIIAIGFIGGILLLQLSTVEQADWLIRTFDRRVLLKAQPSIWQSLWPVVIPFVIVALLASHNLLRHVTRIVVVLKAAFFGYSSGYLIDTQNAFWSYAAWWFPFQLLHSIVLLLFCIVLVPQPVYSVRKKLPIWPRIVVIVITTIIIFAGELVAIHFLFKLK